MSKVKKSILCLLSVVLILLTSVFYPLSVVAAGTSNDLSFESSNVLDDLFSSTVNGLPFDIKNFPFNEKSSIQILNFVEENKSSRTFELSRTLVKRRQPLHPSSHGMDHTDERIEKTYKTRGVKDARRHVLALPVIPAAYGRE